MRDITGSAPPVLRRALLAGLGVACALACDPRDDEIYSGTVDLQDVHVGSLVGGRVLAVEAREGERVEAGRVLVRLDPREWNATLAEAQSQADAAAKRLALLEAGTRKEQIEQAEAEAERQRLLWQVVALGSRTEEVEEARQRVEAARATAKLMENEHQRVANLAQTGDATPSEIDAARSRNDEAKATVAALAQRLALLEAGLRKEEVAAAEAAYRKAEAYVAELKAGPRPEEVAAAKAETAAGRARVAFIESKIAELTIAAPSAAVVQTLDLRPGDLVDAGRTVAILLLPEECRLRLYVPEDRLGRVATGQRATIRFDGLDRAYEGRVSWISREAEFTPRNVQSRSERVTQVFAVRLAIEGEPAAIAALKDGLWGDVTLAAPPAAPGSLPAR